MDKMFADSARWIWHNAPAKEDEFSDFYADFSLEQEGDLTLVISADSNYSAWLDGSLVAFGQYSDYPDYKVADSVSFPAAAGKHRLAVQVWYYGVDTQTYRKGEAGVIFSLSQGGVTLLSSGPDTPARLSPEYLPHTVDLISSQLGPTFHYDAARADGWRTSDEALTVPFAPARVVEGVSTEFHPRPIKKLTLGDRCPSKLVQHGSFSYTLPDSARTADRMQSAALAWISMKDLSDQYDRALRPVTLRTQQGDGVYMIFDLGREEAGFVELELDVPNACSIDIGYGEHLADGRCRTAIRGFTANYHAKAGQNRYLHTYRRFGARYLQCFVHSPEVTLRYFGLRPTNYPLDIRPFDAGNALRRRIYDTCLRTLQLCMHEHYEDCPWREQALYTMDSRNQMLCGYYTFGETRFARACLELMTHGFGPSGLMNLCFPAGRDYPIPFFSLMYFIQMREYMDFSGDESLVRDHYDLLLRLMNLFLDRRDENGLTPSFTDPSIWNFYEWQPTLHGELHGDSAASFDAPLNGFLSLALEALSAICQRIGRTEEAARFAETRLSVNRAMQNVFYNPTVGLFETFDRQYHGAYSVLTNSLCLLCGAAEGQDTGSIERLLVGNGKHMASALQATLITGPLGMGNVEEGSRLVLPNTLSMNCFRYDALLKVSKQKYAPVVLEEIDEVYFMMLRAGATTFWETIEGEADFGDAGSLCHGWSALPAYYYHILRD